MSVLKCDPNLSEMKERLAEARTAKSTRLFALAYDPASPLQWRHSKDEAAMKKFLDSREESESIMFNCAIAVVVVNPTDSDETIEAIIAAKQPRNGTGPGYFREAW